MPPASTADATGDTLASLALLAATIAALAVANTGLYPLYQAALATPVQVAVGAFDLADPLKAWIKNGLMAVFFLFVGLEIKAEIVSGALSTVPKAALPLACALGGLAVPALTYLAITAGQPGLASGWAIPAATDIAFAVGVIGLLGRAVPASLKSFLLAVAVIDDLMAILIIALFYTAEIHIGPLAWAAAFLALLAALNLLGVARLAPYMLAGAALWVAVLKSGVNPTLAGVLTAFFVPMRPQVGGSDPLHDLMNRLKVSVFFVVMPVFAFANAGVRLTGLGLPDLTHPATLGIAAGLLLGKPVGILLCAALATRAGLASRPEGASWPQLAGVACIAGIGFTMSLFIGALAFTDDRTIDQVRLGVLLGSFASALAGAAILLSARPALRPPAPQPSAPQPPTFRPPAL